jgi:hypothetical protein
LIEYAKSRKLLITGMQNRRIRKATEETNPLVRPALGSFPIADRIRDGFASPALYWVFVDRTILNEAVQSRLIPFLERFAAAVHVGGRAK